MPYNLPMLGVGMERRLEIPPGARPFFTSGATTRLWPENHQRCDVLVLANAFVPRAVDAFLMHRLKVLNDAGIATVLAEVTVASDVAGLIKELGPRLVMNDFLVLSPEHVEALASRLRGTQFVSVLHGSQSAATEWLKLQSGHLAVARRRDNCWYGVVEERESTRRVFGRKCLWVPNAFHAPFAWPLWPLGERPAVSIDCANRLLKNIPNQIVATALAARHRDLTLKLFIDRPEQLESLLLDCGVEYEIILPKPWQQHVDEISTSVDVGLQCSFSESFNYTCLEHLYAGKPVVGSRAIAFCPWQVDDPDDPEAIARLLLDVLNRYDECSVEARERAVEVIARNNAALVDVVDGLLVGEEVHCG